MTHKRRRPLLFLLSLLPALLFWHCDSKRGESPKKGDPTVSPTTAPKPKSAPTPPPPKKASLKLQIPKSALGFGFLAAQDVAPFYKGWGLGTPPKTALFFLLKTTPSGAVAPLVFTQTTASAQQGDLTIGGTTYHCSTPLEGPMRTIQLLKGVTQLKITFTKHALGELLPTLPRLKKWNLKRLQATYKEGHLTLRFTSKKRRISKYFRNEIYFFHQFALSARTQIHLMASSGRAVAKALPLATFKAKRASLIYTLPLAMEDLAWSLFQLNRLVPVVPTTPPKE